MGSKGSQTTQTSQNQQSQYVPAGAGFMQAALGNATALGAQGTPTIPTAPVAGFSQDQQNAFQNVNNAQGMAQPYINQAANYFSPQGAQQFLNPYASNVMAGLQNVFGQQQQQNNANLVQSAGGVGADRIAVGQGNLANQQGLAAGQTLSGLYQNAVQQAQGAGYGTAALGSQAQNSALQGAQAQLGTGGLQQQLQQAQLNAPYQQQLAQQALPYQLSQWYSGQVGALAPALGGSTYGQGTGTSASQYDPSLFSQLAGLGLLGGGLLGKGSGGAVPYARGGGVDPPANDEGRYAPIDVSGGLFSNKKLLRLPDQSLPPAPTHVPSVNMNLNPQQQPNMQQQGMQGMQGMLALGRSMNKTGWGDSAQDALQDAGYLARGGAANPYRLPHFDDGGGAGDGDGGGGGSSPGSGDAGGGGGGGDGGIGGSVGDAGANAGDGGGGGGGSDAGTGGIGSDAAASAAAESAAAAAAAANLGNFGEDSDASAAGVAGALGGIPGGVGNIGEDNATGDLGSFGNFASMAGVNLGASPGLNPGANPAADAAASQAALSGLATGVGLSDVGQNTSMVGPPSAANVNGAGINAGFGYGTDAFGLGVGNMTAPATEANTAPPSMSIPGTGYGPAQAPSLAATLGFSQPSLNPSNQQAQEAALAAQAMAESIPGTSSHAESMPSQQAPPGAVSAAVAAALGLPGQVANAIGQGVNTATGAAMSAVSNLPGPASPNAPAPGPASPAAPPAVSDPAPALSFAPTPDTTSAFGNFGMGFPGMGGGSSGMASSPGGNGAGALMALAQQAGLPYQSNGFGWFPSGYPMPKGPQGFDSGGSVNPYQLRGYQDGSDVPVDDDSQQLGSVDRAYQQLAGLGFQRGQIDAAVERAGPAAASAAASLIARSRARDTGTGLPGDTPYREVPPTDMTTWRGDVDADRAAGRTAQGSDAPQDGTALGYDKTRSVNSPAVSALNKAAAGSSSANANPYAPPPDVAPPDVAPPDAAAPLTGIKGYFNKLTHDPTRMALIMAGLGAWTPQGIAGGLQQGMQLVQHQQSADLQAKKLEQEANFHADTMKHQGAQEQETARYHSWEMGKPVPYNAGYDQYNQPLHGLMVPEKQPDGTIKWTPQMPGQAQTKAPDNYQIPGQQGAATASMQQQEGEGDIPYNARLIAGGPYDYAHSGPSILKGMELPEPTQVGDIAPGVLKRDAERYALEGPSTLPPVRGTRGKVASDANDYRNAVRNYGDALLASRGISPEESADLWRGSKGYLRYILGQGKSVVAIGNVMRHSEVLRDIAKELNSGNFTPSNKLKATISSMFGSAAATNLETAAGIVGPEILKALGVAGAGGIGERAEVKAGFGPGASIPQINGAIDTTQRLLGGQLEGQRGAAALAGVDEEHFKRLMGDKPYEMLTKMEKPSAGAAPGAAQAGARTVVRQGSVTAGPNKGKKIIEYSDGTKEYQ